MSGAAGAASGTALIAVDIGNSAAKLLLVDAAGSDAHHQSFRIDETTWTMAAIDWAQGIVGSHACFWRVASVHRGAAQNLLHCVAQAWPEATLRLITRKDIPLAVDVEFPERVGIDRLLGAYAAVSLAAVPLVVVDAGSAVTVDWVDAAGTFCGGAILPGLRLQTNALATGTDALPSLDWGTDQPLEIPGRNTLAAIRLGVTTAVAAAIDRLTRQYIGGQSVVHPAAVGWEDPQQSERGTLLITGGDARILSPHLTVSHQLVTNLVCRGLLLLPR